jgi:glycosyltransferase involved in cell wall biosynthesis
LFSKDTVTVITATIGHRFLGRCAESVQRQTYPHVEHYVVADGIEHHEKMVRGLDAFRGARKKLVATVLPYATGKEGWCGHRIYAAFSMLCNTEFVCFLDDDNWFEPDHIESLVNAMRATNAAWGFSLRRIMDAGANFLALDQCESLGNLHPVFDNPIDWHVDTNCYLLRRETAVAVAPVWYRPIAGAINHVTADRMVVRYLMQSFPAICSSRKYSVNYTADAKSTSVNPKFFLDGNRIMRERYPNGLPWETPGK